MYCWRTRTPRSFQIMLKEIFADDSAVEYSFTGRETSPKAIVEVPIARAAIDSRERMFSGQIQARIAPFAAPHQGPLQGSVVPRLPDRRYLKIIRLACQVFLPSAECDIELSFVRTLSTTTSLPPGLVAAPRRTLLLPVL